MKIATYNVNSINARVENLTAWLAEAAPDVVLVQDLEKLQEKDIKDKKLDLVEELEEDLKVVKHHYIEDYQKEVLKIYMQKIIQK